MSALPHYPERLNCIVNIVLHLRSVNSVKVAYAQQAGAKGVIIINTKENLIRMPAGWMKFQGDVSARSDYFFCHLLTCNQQDIVDEPLRKPIVCPFVRRF